jgi:phosphoglucomutase
MNLTQSNNSDLAISAYGEAGRGTDHRQADAWSGEQRPDPRLEGRCRQQLVCGRPSGTENIYKIYAEAFRDQAHLDAILSEVQAMVNNALKSTA